MGHTVQVNGTDKRPRFIPRVLDQDEPYFDAVPAQGCLAQDLNGVDSVNGVQGAKPEIETWFPERDSLGDSRRSNRYRPSGKPSMPSGSIVRFS